MSNDAVAAMKAAREVLGIGLKSAESPPFIEKTENAIRKLDAAIKAQEEGAK